MHDDFISIKKIFKIIDSCIDINQLKNCKKIADLYTNIAYSKGVVNYELIREVLYIRINEKLEEMNIAFKFNERIKKIKFIESEYDSMKSYA